MDFVADEPVQGKKKSKETDEGGVVLSGMLKVSDEFNCKTGNVLHLCAAVRGFVVVIPCL